MTSAEMWIIRNANFLAEQIFLGSNFCIPGKSIKGFASSLGDLLLEIPEIEAVSYEEEGLFVTIH